MRSCRAATICSNWLSSFRRSQRTDWLPGRESHEIHGTFKLGFRVANLDATFAQVQSAELEIFFEIVQTSGPLRTFGLLDPEGNIVQFFGE